MSAHKREVRQDGLLYIDRNKAVAQNLEALKKMIRPGNVPSVPAPVANPSHNK